jgi:protein TonB
MMTNAQLATASLNDIVFDGRNQRYGAYELRGLYQRHVTRALVIATALCALLLVFPLVAQLLKGKTPPVTPTPTLPNPIIVDMPVVPVVTPPPAAAKPPVQPPQPPTVKNLVMVVVEDRKASPESEVPTQKELEEKLISTKTSEGDPNAGSSIVDDLEDLKTGKEEGAVGETVGGKPYRFVEQMPELPGGGGQAAIVAAIQRAVKYPRQALSNGVEGKVFVSFTVTSKGDVVDVQIVKGLGSGLDEETLRAIKTLPKFIPGKQNGREVSVSFTVPVTYQIQ